MKHAIAKPIAALAMVTFVVIMALPSVSAAGAALDPASMSWVMVSTALVMLMTPGVALFYAGMLRKESVMSILGQTMMMMVLVTLVWITIGYSLAFGPSAGGIVGGLDHILLNNVSYGESTIEAGLPDLQFMLFQLTFAMITAALVLGAIAERTKLKALVIFMVIWSIVVYSPIAHWVWGGGWFDEHLVSLDFAGGTVVHICSGVTALALAMVVGRRGSNIQKDRPHNLPLVFIGGALLWFGWFGFNGGSALAADGIAVNAMVVTQISAAAAAGTWALINWFHLGRPGVLGMVTGAIAGLVGITPAAGFVGPVEAIVIGIGAGALCYAVVALKHKLRADDALDVFAVHGVGGAWGAMATGILAVPAITSDAGADGVKGLIYGGTDLFAGQLITVGVTAVYAFVLSFAIIKVISMFMDIRLEKKEEMIGQDLIEHGEAAYDI